MHAAGKTFVNTYLKAIEIPLVPICGIYQYVNFYPTEGESLNF